MDMRNLDEGPLWYANCYFLYGPRFFTERRKLG
jgi:hypothetical protein